MPRHFFAAIRVPIFQGTFEEERGGAVEAIGADEYAYLGFGSGQVPGTPSRKLRHKRAPQDAGT
jgi:hypothetical protein